MTESIAIRNCAHCRTVFPAGLSRYCSDECMFAANPDMPRADARIALTPAQRREAQWEAQLDERQRGYDFGSLKPRAKTHGGTLVQRWTREAPGSVLILGASEAGKTYVAYRLARVAFLRGWKVRHSTAETLRAKWLEERKSIQRAATADILLIDDLGMENTTDGWCSAVYELVKYREDHGLPTIVTANRTREYFADRYSTALANRLWRMEVVEL